MNRKKSTIKETVTIDVKTGELLDVKHDKVSYETEPIFIKMYIDDISRLQGFTISQNDCLRLLLLKMTWEGDLILHSLIKAEIAAKLKIGLSIIQKNIATYVEKGILIKRAKNYYLFNPYLFAYGKWSDIKKLRMTIEYTATGRAIKTDFYKNAEAIQTNLNFENNE